MIHPHINVCITKPVLDISPEIVCSCGRCIFEADANYCSSCGDVMCKACYTDCLTCGKMYCENCSHNPAQCLKCHSSRTQSDVKSKAFLVLDGGVSTPIKNSPFMILKTSVPNARDITLRLAGNNYKYCYRQMVRNKEDNGYDYFLYFEKDTFSNELHRKIKEAFDDFSDGDYDDYGNPWGIGW